MNKNLLYQILDAYLQGASLDDVRRINSVGQFEHEFHRDLPGAIEHMDHVRDVARPTGLYDEPPKEPTLKDVLYVAGFYSYKFHELAIKKSADKFIIEQMEKRLEQQKEFTSVYREKLAWSEELNAELTGALSEMGFKVGAKVRFKKDSEFGHNRGVYEIQRIGTYEGRLGIWISFDPRPFNFKMFELYKKKWYDFTRR